MQMATLMAEEFISAIDEGLDFIPIHISSLRLDSLTGFDLYLQVRLLLFWVGPQC